MCRKIFPIKCYHNTEIVLLYGIIGVLVGFQIIAIYILACQNPPEDSNHNSIIGLGVFFIVLLFLFQIWFASIIKDIIDEYKKFLLQETLLVESVV